MPNLEDGGNVAQKGFRVEEQSWEKIDEFRKSCPEKLKSLVFGNSPTFFVIDDVIELFHNYGEYNTIAYIEDIINNMTVRTYGEDHPEYDPPPPPKVDVHDNNVDAGGAFADF